MKIINASRALIVLTIAALSTACTPSYENKNGSFSSMPEELKDCAIFRLRGSDGTLLYVTKCPHADTATTTTGKSSKTVVLVQE